MEVTPPMDIVALTLGHKTQTGLDEGKSPRGTSGLAVAPELGRKAAIRGSFRHPGTWQRGQGATRASAQPGRDAPAPLLLRHREKDHESPKTGHFSEEMRGEDEQKSCLPPSLGDWGKASSVASPAPTDAPGSEHQVLQEPNKKSCCNGELDGAKMSLSPLPRKVIHVPSAAKCPGRTWQQLDGASSSRGRCRSELEAALKAEISLFPSLSQTVGNTVGQSGRGEGDDGLDGLPRAQRLPR